MQKDIKRLLKSIDHVNILKEKKLLINLCDSLKQYLNYLHQYASIFTSISRAY